MNSSKRFKLFNKTKKQLTLALLITSVISFYVATDIFKIPFLNGLSDASDLGFSVKQNYYKKFLYIYDVPNKFTLELLSESRFELFPGNKYSQWQTEFYIHQIICQSAYVTRDPDEATIFFVPLYGSGMKSLSNNHRVEIWSDLMIWLKQQKSKSGIAYVDKNAGFDHTFVFGAARSWCKPSKPLQITAKCLGLNHKLLFDTNFIKMTVEFTGLCQEHLESKAFRNRIGQIMIIPYMQYDVKSALGFQFYQTELSSPQIGRRENLLYFSGSLLPKTAPFRELFKAVCDEYADCIFGKSFRRKFNSSELVYNFQRSTFCAILGGDSRASKRLFDAISSLCIPVIFDPLLALPFSDSIPYDQFVLQAPFIRKGNTVHETLQKLRYISDTKIIEMQKSMQIYSSYLSYFSKREINAIDMIIQRLHMRGETIAKKDNLGPEFDSVGYLDWQHLALGLCGPSGPSSCRVFTQNVVT